MNRYISIRQIGIKRREEKVLIVDPGTQKPRVWAIKELIPLPEGCEGSPCSSEE
jgi:hypothetical protein